MGGVSIKPIMCGSYTSAMQIDSDIDLFVSGIYAQLLDMESWYWFGHMIWEYGTNINDYMTAIKAVSICG